VHGSSRRPSVLRSWRWASLVVAALVGFSHPAFAEDEWYLTLYGGQYAGSRSADIVKFSDRGRRRYPIIGSAGTYRGRVSGRERTARSASRMSRASSPGEPAHGPWAGRVSSGKVEASRGAS
jgi:hypothetical protein